MTDEPRHPAAPLDRVTGLVESGEHNAHTWLQQFNAACARKLGMAVFPGSLNLRLVTLNNHPAYLWTTTTPRDAEAQRVIEIVTDVSLRATFGLRDGDAVTVEILTPSHR